MRSSLGRSAAAESTYDSSRDRLLACTRRSRDQGKACGQSLKLTWLRAHVESFV